jgi:hypothetical protein
MIEARNIGGGPCDEQETFAACFDVVSMPHLWCNNGMQNLEKSGDMHFSHGLTRSRPCLGGV